MSDTKRVAIIGGDLSRTAALVAMLGAGFELRPVDESLPSPAPKPILTERESIPDGRVTRQQRRFAERRAGKNS